MRRITTLFLVASLVLAMSFSASAQEPKGSMMGKGMTKGRMMGQKGMMMGQGKMMGMCPMCGMMMQMMKKSMIATKDGGIIVMTGDKLQKYDKDLNLKKQVKIKMDMKEMQKMMMQMREKCPMYKMMMQEGTMTGERMEEPETPEESE